MGLGRAGDRAMGKPSVTASLPGFRRFGLLALATVPLAGCAGAADITGAVTGTAATIATTNPVVGVGVGLGVRAATTTAVNYVFRRRHRFAQDELAAVIGSMDLGETRPWKIEYDLPIGNAHGEVRLVRIVDNLLAPCREALFSVSSGDGPEAPRRWFLTTACRQATGWKWASAEPATGRWGSLH
jgi:hypothetical protein